MKKFLIVFLIFIIGSNCFGMELNNSQKQIVREYPTWTIDHKIKFFIKISKNQSQVLPKTLDPITNLIGIDSLLDRPGLKYTNQLGIKKNDFSNGKWKQTFEIIEMNLKNSSCSSDSGYFYRELKDVVLIYDYFDMDFQFLKRIIIDFKKDCS